MLHAVLYLRSSKDRHDVAIEVQRRELTELARVRDLVVDGEFADVVESGKDEDRPGLQGLLAALYNKARAWTVVLTLDTSRIARRAAAAYWFEDRECRPRGVTVVYKNLPDMAEAERAIVKAIFHGVDEWHSLVSKRKGLAGMRQNVHSGFRAGGRAPLGYQLEHVPTGAVREGTPVLKSRLVLADRAPAVQGFLRDRAAGVSRVRAAAKHGLEIPDTTLLGIERNALNYAGHTVWNRLNERGRLGGRYRPRAEWEIKRDTHPALISDDQAEAILAQLRQRTPPATHKVKHEYLLAGLLRTPAGQPWHGTDAGFYRHGAGRRILARRVDQAVVESVNEDLVGDRLVRALMDHMRTRLLDAPDLQRAAALRRQVAELDRKARRLADLAANAQTPAPLLRAIGAMEGERADAHAELDQIGRESTTRRALEAITEDQVRQGLRNIAVDLRAGRDVPGLRDQLTQLLERVELDPLEPRDVVLQYRVPAFTGVGLASPQRREDNPGDLLTKRVKLAA